MQANDLEKALVERFLDDPNLKPVRNIAGMEWDRRQRSKHECSRVSN
jgi:hypothetical protein